MQYAIVEKKNHNALHSLFDSKERAENHLKNVVPSYIERSYYMNKTLTKDCFEIINYNK